MGLSYTSAIDRDLQRVRARTQTVGARHLIMPLTSLIAVLAIGLAYAGRVHTMAIANGGGAATVVNLNIARDAAALEPALQHAFAESADRRFAARALFEFLLARRAGGSVPNVGALLAATVPVQAIEREPSLTVYPERLRAVRERAKTAGAPAPVALSVLTADDLAKIKPALIVRTPETFARLTIVDTAAYLAGFYAVLLLWGRRQFRGDLVLLASVHLLTAAGFALLLSRPDPLRDAVLFERYTIGIVLGLAALAGVSLIDFRKATFLTLSYVPLVAALALSLILIVFGDGPGDSRAKVNLGPVQPIEAIRLLLALFLAGYFARRWELLRQISTPALGSRRLPRWVNVPRLEYVLPVVVGVGGALLLFVLQRDLGPALFLACVFLATYAVARARVSMALVGLATLVAGFYVGYRLNVSETLTARVRMWQSPWDNVVRGGDQVAQSIWALSTGGWFGTGFGLGDTRYLPAGHTDLVLSAVGEELGVAGLLALAAVYGLIAARGLRIGRRAANDYGFFLATTVTLFLTIPVLMMGAGVLGITPLTGVVTPFLSYGGSAMVANLAALGMLIAIGAHQPRTSDAPAFRRPTLCLGAALAVPALVVIGVACRVAVVSADDYAVRPHLSLQADGVRRYQYNPRVLDVARAIPRGTVYDRRGLALATGDAAVLRRARVEYAKHGIALNEACAEPARRCYPLGGAAFHLLGDEATRINWTATNTSYIEREADSRLRGFDDHAATVVFTDAAGQPRSTIRRDYRDLLPLLRHRHERDHPAVRSMIDRDRDLHVTVDARLQLDVAAILSKYAARSRTGRAAAVVVDTDSGNLLAAVSYPFPSSDNGLSADEHFDADTLLDRARYGLYPPGSTFKLVTAAAALRQHLDSRATTFTCAYLPNGRVGAQIPGWTRPIRDDVLDKTPHGTLGLHEAVVHSCNAYFAQLAVRVGPAALMDTAKLLGISTTSTSLQRLRDTLPQAGYGQGDVVATPLRMARVVAALASDGVLRDVTWEAREPRTAATERLLPPEESALLSRYLRDAVLTGTGRTLRDHPLKIAGKTGTAEVTGAPSHSWFAGFAPYGGATKIAFAVIVENAGYGASAAAPIAGEIVSAAAAAGLIR